MDEALCPRRLHCTATGVGAGLPAARHEGRHRVEHVGERMRLGEAAARRRQSLQSIPRSRRTVDAALRREPVAKMLLTVHDELVFEVPAESLPQARALIEKHMTGAASLRCGLAVDIHTGHDWAEAHA